MKPIRAVLFDWAGTTVDYGSRAPAQVFVEIFARIGIEVTEAEARGPMGMAKRDHISAVLHLPRVAELWRKKFGREPADADVQRLYDEFLPLQKSVLAHHCDVIPGVIETIAELRRRGIRIGSTTGYTRELMDVVVPLARAAGFDPEVVICSDEVTAGRPAPWSNFRAAEKLGVYPMSEVLVVDDTPHGIAAGIHAGMRALGVTMTGNSLGLSERQVHDLAASELNSRLLEAERAFRAAGAHDCLRSAADLIPWLDSQGL